MNWENLCRFCGIQYEKELDLKNQSMEILLEVLQKLFFINDSELNFKVCTRCYDFINSICKFYEKAKKVENIFLELKNSTIKSEIDIDKNKSNSKLEISTENIHSDNEAQIEKSCEITKRLKEFNKREIKTNIRENEDLNLIHNGKQLFGTSQKKNSNENVNIRKKYDINLRNQTTKTIYSVKSIETNQIKQAKIKCTICNMIFYRESNFTTHNKKIHSIIEEIEPCNACGKKFSSKGTLRAHEKLHLSLEEKEKYYFKCPHCNIKYPQRAQMLNHIRRIHSKERPFICESCGKSYTSQNNLYSHRKEAHERIETACPICKKIFKTASRMRNHIKCHKEPSIPCTICGDFLKSKKNLKNHMLIHSDVKAYKCNYCQKEFKRDITLQLHMLIHTGLRPFICRFCGQSYAHPSNCKKHEQQLHTYEYQNAVNKTQGINIPLRKFEKLPNIKQLHEMLEDLKVGGEINCII